MSEGKEETAATYFTLKNADRGFEGRSSDIFGGLDVLERKHVSHEQDRTDVEDFADLRHDDDDDADLADRSNSGMSRPNTNKKVCERGSNQDGNIDRLTNPDNIPENIEADMNPSKTQNSGDAVGRGVRPQSAGRPAMFRRPSGRAPGRRQNQRNRVPDHGKGPQSWTHYSLEDVKGSDMSEKSNTQTALAFLDERRKLREKQEKEEMGLGEEEAFDVGSAACSKGLLSFTKKDKTNKSSGLSDKGKFDRDRPSATDTWDKLDTGEEVEGATEKESTDSSMKDDAVKATDSSMKDDAVKAGFKSRKGIKRNIRARDDDD